MRIFGSDIDIALVRAHSKTGNRHAFDQHEGIAFHHHAVSEGAAIAFIGVADDIFARSLGIGNRPPFDPGWKASPAAPAQS